MTIYFSPEYSGQVYIKPVDGDVLMETVVVNTIGFINILEFRLGLHYDEIPARKRTVLYYRAMSEYIKTHPESIMAASFKTSGLRTAKAVLAWRDELRMAKWDFKGEEISSRLRTIIGIEEEFQRESGADLAERISIVKDRIASGRLNCHDMTIVIPFKLSCFKPIIKELIEILEANGAKISLLKVADDTDDNLGKIRGMLLGKETGKITFNSNDSSFLIYHFPDEHAADEFLAVNGDDIADVWINMNNKQMDNWLSLTGKPVTGSVVDNCSPQVAQLFIMGIGLFYSPLNVNTLIGWLNIPVHPIDSYSRGKLAEKIINEGGYRNKECQDEVNKYISGDYVFLNDEQKTLPEEEQNLIRRKEMAERKRLADVFLPSMEMECPDSIDVGKLMNFVTELGSWSCQRASFLSKENRNRAYVEQLHSVGEMCDALLTLLETATERIDFHTLDSWVSEIYKDNHFTHAISEAGSRCVVSEPTKIISNPDRTIWMEFDGENTHNMECSFLNPSEKKELIGKGFIMPWEENDERRYNELSLSLPFLLTHKQLILVVCNRRGGEETVKHPLIVRLEQKRLFENIECVIREPKFEMSQLEKVEPLDNGCDMGEIHISHPDKFKWPDHLSPTNLSTLVEYPFDFLLKNIHIEPGINYQMANINATMGNVAHKVIEKLFAPRDGSATADAKEIKERIDREYERVFKETVEEKGAILLLSENILKKGALHEQLHGCLDVLVDIISMNDLKVTGCERSVDAYMKFGLPQREDGNEKDMVGHIDMSLADKTGSPVIIDFKWTTYRNYYQTLIKENRSIQLEWYRRLLSVNEGRDVKRVAYFLMPMAQLFSKDAFKGDNCTQLTPENQNDIVEQLTNSVLYRKEQIDNGIVEINGEFDELQYVRDTPENNLFPLKKDKKNGYKIENKFSEYTSLLNK